MPRFGKILCEDKTFVNDKITFDFSKSIITPDETPAVISHEFSIDNITWINVTSTKSIDWLFNTIGIKSIYLRLTSTSGSDVSTRTVSILNLSAQNLFSSDSDLSAYEPEIMKWLPKKWSAWNLIHLRAQEYIMNMLRERSIFDKNNTPYVVADIFDLTEVKDLSVALVLRYIFSGTSNASDDVFKKKSDYYDELVSTRSAKATIKLDFNKNSVADDHEITDLRSIEIRRG